MVHRYIVTANVKGRKERITEDLPKKKAMTFARNLRRDMRVTINKYKWASNIRVEKV